ncbi:hypothetical protein FA10DRAFT_298718 [Acaromyces ingoldii]|uniref:Protein N-terminal glutamine amidohydrolase n=1 Tax=Acaromyces ingoldii TaxID=215250 RepID=A0A316YVV0_9BASI|nr:hypothetical protein FA10DRAFT_298718 [Acaromyces ingoldii]PWN93311.1 hypothetical protein FA10DRAFT_298718 [Acaromyces ingoldii]
MSAVDSDRAASRVEAPVYAPVQAGPVALPPLAPPPLPRKEHYAACYCEENAYILATHLADTCTRLNDAAATVALPVPAPASASAATATASDGSHQWVSRQVWDVDVVIVSNGSRTVALWQQRASRDPSTLVIWDYHVFVLVSCSLVQSRVPAGARSSSSSSQSLRKGQDEGANLLATPARPGLLKRLSSSSLRGVTQRSSSSSSSGGAGSSSVNGRSSPSRPSFSGTAAAPLQQQQQQATTAAAMTKKDKDNMVVTHLQSWVYDVDSILGPGPVSFQTYATETFRDPQQTPTPYRARFRVVAANDYLAYFSSDRRHMMLATRTFSASSLRPSASLSRKHKTTSTDPKDSQTERVDKTSPAKEKGEEEKEEEGGRGGLKIRWAAEPPEWPPICGPLARVGRSNLMSHYVDMKVRFKSRYGLVLTDRQFLQAAWKRVRPGATLEGVGELELSVRSLQDMEALQLGLDQDEGEEEEQEEEGVGEGEEERRRGGRGEDLAQTVDLEEGYEDEIQQGYVEEPSPGVVVGDVSRQSFEHYLPQATGPPLRPPPPPPPGSVSSTTPASRRGGRVKDPLFPAYLAASLQHRAARSRGSYLGVEDFLDTDSRGVA